MLTDLSLAVIIQRIIAATVLAGVYGFLLAGLARLMGDRTPEHEGRLTLLPFGHLSLLGVVSSVVARAGWIAPMDIDHRQLRWGRAGLAVCVFASLAILVVFGLLVLWSRIPVQALLPSGQSGYVIGGLTAIADLAFGFAILNLLPLPPLAGGHLLIAIRPQFGRAAARQAPLLGGVILIVLIITRGGWISYGIRAIRVFSG